MDSRCSSIDSRPTFRGLGSVSSTPLSARVESYEAVEKKCISDVRRTFCLFVTFDLLFVTLVWIIELNLTTAISCAFLIVKVILTKLLSQETTGAFGYLLPIASFILAWIETWLLDFKVLPQEAEEENRYQSFVDAAERAPLMGPAPLSDGQFYSPPESLADSDEDLEDKQDPEKGLIHRGS